MPFDIPRILITDPHGVQHSMDIDDQDQEILHWNKTASKINELIEEDYLQDCMELISNDSNHRWVEKSSNNWIDYGSDFEIEDDGDDNVGVIDAVPMEEDCNDENTIPEGSSRPLRFERKSPSRREMGDLSSNVYDHLFDPDKHSQWMEEQMLFEKAKMQKAQVEKILQSQTTPMPDVEMESKSESNSSKKHQLEKSESDSINKSRLINDPEGRRRLKGKQKVRENKVEENA